MSEIARWPGDTVVGLDPVSFAVEFTRGLRRQPGARWVPSLRTSLAIPRLLAARWFRTQALTSKDYLEVAIACTPVEDRALAEAVARSLLYPESETERKVAPKTEEAVAASDPMAGILGDLASLDIDLDALQSFDELLAEEESAEDPSAFELFERLYSSAEPAERGIGELIHSFGGPAELEASAIRTPFLAKVWVARQLLSRVGELEPSHLLHGVRAGYGPELRRACTVPWELAGVLAADRDPGLSAHLRDLLQSGSSRELGRTLAFLAPYPEIAAERKAFADAALSRALELSDLAELAVGLGQWIDPPSDLCEASVAANPRRAIESAGWLEQQFGIDLRPDLFVRWLARNPSPDLGMLAVVSVDCPPWSEAVEQAVPREIAGLDGAVETDRRWTEAVELAGRLVGTGFDQGLRSAGRLATETVVRCPSAATFLPLIDAFLDRSVAPDDLERILARARELGVPEEEVLDRLGRALEQLRMLVLQDSHDATRYQRLIARIRELPPEMGAQLCAAAAAAGNLEAMAALLAIDMGVALENLPPERAAEALSYKGIGGGRNLLKQWFTHRGRVPSAIRTQIKGQVKAILLDEAFDWMGKGEGSGEQGLIPQNRARPFQAGDGLDALDLDETLDAIVASGKTVDQISEEDLFAYERTRGKAAMCVLIDISGSMGGGELAACAIAIVMLLGRLLPEEVALAAFESDTHVIKRFDDDVDLDRVADQVLELEATGGTRVDAALDWSADQLEQVPEADLRVLFLLSDFAFFEGEQALRARGSALAGLGTRLLAASHGYVQKDTLALLLEEIGGEQLKLDSLDRLPALMLQALASLKA